MKRKTMLYALTPLTGRCSTRTVVTAALLVLTLTACGSAGLTPTALPVTLLPPTVMANAYPTATPGVPPTLEPALLPDTSMYTPVIDQFFADSAVQQLMQSEILAQPVIYIEPAFSDMGRPLLHSPYTGKALPSALSAQIQAHLAAAGLTRGTQGQEGGGVLTLGSIISADLHNTGQSQPAVGLVFGRWRGGCGRFIQIDYLLTKTGLGWEAKPYDRGRC